MVREIFGSIEVWNRELWQWMEVADAGLLLGRDEAAWSSLFGTGESPFAPVFAVDRGLPRDVSPSVRRWAGAEEYFGQTWASVAELSDTDGNETATDPFVYCYGESDVTGQWIPVGKYRPDPPHGASPGAVWREGKVQCRVRSVTRDEAVGAGFRLVRDILIRLAQDYGDEHVRVVVWFN